MCSAIGLVLALPLAQANEASDKEALRMVGPCEEGMILDVRATTVDGVKGSFIPPGSMNRVTFLLTECLPSYRALILKQGRLLTLQRDAIETSSRAFGLADQMATDERTRAAHWKEAFVDEHRVFLAERTAQDGILHSTIFWFAVGFVAGAGMTLGLAFAYKKIGASSL